MEARALRLAPVDDVPVEAGEHRAWAVLHLPDLLAHRSRTQIAGTSSVNITWIVENGTPCEYRYPRAFAT